MFHNNIEKISKKKKQKTNDRSEFVEILPPSYLPYRFLHNLHSFFSMGKQMKIFDFLKTSDKNKKKFVHR